MPKFRRFCSDRPWSAQTDDRRASSTTTLCTMQSEKSKEESVKSPLDNQCFTIYDGISYGVYLIDG
jgi:hypothetical protein